MKDDKLNRRKEYWTKNTKKKYRKKGTEAHLFRKRDKYKR